MAVALAALFVALGGTGYAVTKLPANSVGTAQVKDNSLLRRDFKRGQIPRGRRGPAGPRGEEGLEGPEGPEGIEGLPGLDGEPGERGPAGPASVAALDGTPCTGIPIQAGDAAPPGLVLVRKEAGGLGPQAGVIRTVIDCITEDVEDQREPPLGNTRDTPSPTPAAGTIFPAGDQDWYRTNLATVAIVLDSDPKVDRDPAAGLPPGPAVMDVYVNDAPTPTVQGVRRYDTGVATPQVYEIHVQSPEIGAYRLCVGAC